MPASPVWSVALKGYLISGEFASHPFMSRITLRNYQMDDWQAVYAFTSAPESSQYDHWEPHTEIQAKLFTVNVASEAIIQPRYHYNLAIILNSTNNLIGGMSICRDSEKSSTASLSCAINPLYKGQGYATEAIKDIILFGFQELNLEVIYGLVEVANIGCIRIMEKAGMTNVGRLNAFKYYKGEYKDYYRYEITRQQHNDLINSVKHE